MKGVFRLAVLMALLCGGLCFSARAATAIPGASVWTYQQPHLEIHGPHLSPDNTHLVFTRLLHLPDGFEGDVMSRTRRKKIRELLADNPQLAEPQVVVMDLAHRQTRRLDTGWEPVFSPDGTRVAYAHQVRPKANQRMLAETLAGNSIRQFDLITGKRVTLARPETGYFSMPRYTAGGGVLYALSAAVNGFWGGHVGVGYADPSRETQAVLLPPAWDHGLQHMVSAYASQRGQCLALRLRPLERGTYLADWYAPELVDAADGTVLHRWNRSRPQESLRDRFRMCPAGPEVFDEGRWRPLHQQAESEGASSRTRTAPSGISSPDCTHVAVLKEGEVTVYAADGAPVRRWRAATPNVPWMVWSPDGTRLVLVVTHGLDYPTPFLHDQLVVLPLAAMTPVLDAE